MVVPVIAAGARAAAGAAVKKGVQSGVQNASRSRRVVNTRSGSLRRAQNPNAHRSRIQTGPERFIAEQRLGSRTGIQDKESEPTRGYDDTSATVQQEATQRNTSVSRSIRRRLHPKITSNLTKRVSFVLIAIAAQVSFFIFIFGVLGISIIGLGQSELFFGIKVDNTISFFGSILSFVTGLNTRGITASGAGMFLSSVATLIAFCSYLGFGLWYQISQNKYPNTTVGMFVTACCAAADMVLITQLFPWLVLWVVLMEFGWLSSASE